MGQKKWSKQEAKEYSASLRHTVSAFHEKEKVEKEIAKGSFSQEQLKDILSTSKISPPHPSKNEPATRSRIGWGGILVFWVRPQCLCAIFKIGKPTFFSRSSMGRATRS